MLAGSFWGSFLTEADRLITKIIILPSRDELDFPRLWKPLIAFRILGFRGFLKMVHFKLFNSSVSLELFCEELVELKSLSAEELYKEVSSSDVDVLISVGAPIVLKPNLLALPKLFSCNLHNGDIKNYRGHFSTFWEIVNKEVELYINLHKMTAKVDSGCIYAQMSARKNSFSNFFDVMIWKKATGGKMLASMLNRLEINKGSVEKQIENANNQITNSKYYPFPSARDVLEFRF